MQNYTNAEMRIKIIDEINRESYMTFRDFLFSFNVKLFVKNTAGRTIDFKINALNYRDDATVKESISVSYGKEYYFADDPSIVTNLVRVFDTTVEYLESNGYIVTVNCDRSPMEPVLYYDTDGGSIIRPVMKTYLKWNGTMFFKTIDLDNYVKRGYRTYSEHSDWKKEKHRKLKEQCAEMDKNRRYREEVNRANEEIRNAEKARQIQNGHTRIAIFISAIGLVVSSTLSFISLCNKSETATKIIPALSNTTDSMTILSIPMTPETVHISDTLVIYDTLNIDKSQANSKVTKNKKGR